MHHNHIICSLVQFQLGSLQDRRAGFFSFNDAEMMWLGLVEVADHTSDLLLKVKIQCKGPGSA